MEVSDARINQCCQRERSEMRGWACQLSYIRFYVRLSMTNTKERLQSTTVAQPFWGSQISLLICYRYIAWHFRRECSLAREVLSRVSVMGP